MFTSKQNAINTNSSFVLNGRKIIDAHIRFDHSDGKSGECDV